MKVTYSNLNNSVVSYNQSISFRQMSHLFLEKHKFYIPTLCWAKEASSIRVTAALVIDGSPRYCWSNYKTIAYPTIFTQLCT